MDDTNVPESLFCSNNFATSVKEQRGYDCNIQENTRPLRNTKLFKGIGSGRRCMWMEVWHRNKKQWWGVLHKKTGWERHVEHVEIANSQLELELRGQKPRNHGQDAGTLWGLLANFLF